MEKKADQIPGTPSYNQIQNLDDNQLSKLSLIFPKARRNSVKPEPYNEQ